jgi:hypothetical protein
LLAGRYVIVSAEAIDEMRTRHGVIFSARSRTNARFRCRCRRYSHRYLHTL